MNQALRSLLFALSFVASFSLAGTVFAGEAQDLVQARRAEVANLMKDKPSAERDRKVAGILGALFDYDAMARRSLGKHWDGLSEAQQAEFTGVLRKLVQRNIEKNVKATLAYDVAFVGEQEADPDTTVKTKASSKSKREEPVTIDYVMHRVGDAWRAHDVITEGSSMVGGYRSQFGRIIAKEGFDGLLKKMRARLEKGA